MRACVRVCVCARRECLTTVCRSRCCSADLKKKETAWWNPPLWWADLMNRDLVTILGLQQQSLLSHAWGQEQSKRCNGSSPSTPPWASCQDDHHDQWLWRPGWPLMAMSPSGHSTAQGRWVQAWLAHPFTAWLLIQDPSLWLESCPMSLQGKETRIVH